MVQRNSAATEIPFPEREGTISFIAGSITATRGVLASMFKKGKFDNGCETFLSERKRISYPRTQFIGDTPRIVDGSNWQEIRFPSKKKGLAAGGEPIKLRIDGEYWTARLSGTHYAFMTWLCGENEKGNLATVITWQSARGTTYGPVGQFTEGDDN